MSHVSANDGLPKPKNVDNVLCPNSVILCHLSTATSTLTKTEWSTGFKKRIIGFATLSIVLVLDYLVAHSNIPCNWPASWNLTDHFGVKDEKSPHLIAPIQPDPPVTSGGPSSHRDPSRDPSICADQPRPRQFLSIYFGWLVMKKSPPPSCPSWVGGP